MSEFQAEWINHGEAITPKPLPFRGQQKVGEVQKERSDVAADFGQTLRLMNFATMLGVRDLLEQSGVGPAKKAWQDNLEDLGLSEEAKEELTFSEDEFEEQFPRMVEDRAIDKLDINQDETPKEAIDREMEEVLGDRHLEDLQREMQRLEMKKAATNLYWRHRNEDVKVTVYDQEEEETVEKKWTIENIERVMTFEDWSNYKAALSQREMLSQADPHEEVEQLFDPEDREELKKSSNSDKRTSESPKPDSEPSLETGTETETKSSTE